MSSPSGLPPARLPALFRALRPVGRGLLSLLYLSLFLVLCGGYVWRPLAPYLDFWVHAAAGRWAWEHGEVPRRTLFLWTASEPWVAHHWLTQVLFYGLTRLSGEDRLPHVVLGFTVLVVSACYALVWDLWGRRGRVSAWVLLPFYLSMIVSYPRFQPRPELFTTLLLTVQFRLLVGWPGAAPRLRLAALLGVLALWVNLHGGVVAGLLVLGVTAFCDLLQDGRTRPNRLLLLALPLAALAVQANPYGVGYWLAFRPVSGQTFARIEEWKPLWRLSPLPVEQLAGLGVLLALALLGWARNPARRWAQLGWLVLTAGMFASAQRNGWLLAQTCLVVMAANAAALDPEVLWRGASRRLRRPGAPGLPPPAYLRWLARAAVTAWLLMQIFIRSHAFVAVHSLVPRRLATGAVRFVREQGLVGHPFNDYENASYLQWCFAGNPELFIDLMNAYPDAVTRDYLDVLNVSARGRELLRPEGGLDWVLLTTNRPGPSLAALADYLDHSPDWLRVYAGGDGAVWVRHTPQTGPRWRRLAASVNRSAFGELEMYNYETPP